MNERIKVIEKKEGLTIQCYSMEHKRTDDVKVSEVAPHSFGLLYSSTTSIHRIQVGCNK